MGSLPRFFWFATGLANPSNGWIMADEKSSNDSKTFFSRVGVGNFKAFGKLQSVVIKPITLIYGPNSSGKSSFLQSLLYLEEAQRNKNFDVKKTRLGEDFVDLGGFEQFIHGQKAEGRSLFFDLDLGACDDFGDIVLALDIRHSTKAGKSEVKLEKATIKSNGNEVMVLTKKHDEDSYKISFPNETEEYYQDGIEAKTRLDNDAMRTELNKLSGSLTVEGDGLLPAIVSGNANKEKIYQVAHATSRLRELLEAVGNRLLDYLGVGKLRYLGPLRSIPERNFKPDTEKNWHSAGGSAWNLIEESEVVRNDVNKWLKEFFNDKYRIVSAPFYSEKNITKSVQALLNEIRVELVGEETADKNIQGSEKKSRNEKEDLEKSKALVHKTLGTEKKAGGDEALFNEDKEADEEQEEGPDNLKDDGNEAIGETDEISHLYNELIKKITGIKKEEDTWAEKLLDKLKAKKSDLKLMSGGVELSPKDVGVGVSQLIPLIASACAYTDSTILIEQPELHLHPGQQADLGDLFIHNTGRLSQNHTGNTLIIETHSQHILERIGKRMRDHESNKEANGAKPKPITPNDVAVYYINPSDEGGVRVRTMELTEDGYLARDWPDGFFNEDMQDLG